MPLTGPSFLILGVVVASVTREVASTNTEFPITPKLNTSNFGKDNMSISVTTAVTTSSPMNFTNSTIMSSTTMQNGSERLEETITTTIAPTTPIGPLMSTISTTKKKFVSESKVLPDKPAANKTDNTGIIILVIIILVAVMFGVVCYCLRRRGRRYSVDHVSRGDDANIPLSFMEPEIPADTLPPNGLQTFEREGAATTRPQEPELQGETKEAELGDPSAETAALALLPDSSEDKPTVDVTNLSPPVHMEPSIDEKTDDEDISAKTSAESLREKNENNNNSVYLSQQRDLKQGDLFWDIPLDWPV